MRWLVLVIASACVDPGDPPLQAAPLISVSQESGIVVTGQTYSIAFSPNGVKLPSQLRVGGRDLLASNPVNNCNGSTNLESKIGVNVFPALSILGGTEGESTAELVLEGPAIAKVDVTYDVDYECGGTQRMHGVSQFTMFPFGRIMREDRLTPGTTLLDRTSDPCGCETGGTTNFFFTSFYAFEEVADPAKHVDEAGVATTGGEEQACTLFADAAVGVRWFGNSTRVHPRPNEVSAHIFDIEVDKLTLPVGDPRIVQSSLQVIAGDPGSAAQCVNILAQLAPAPMTISGTTIMRNETTGIYVDDTRHTSAFEISTPSSLPSGFAVRLDLGGATHARITRTPSLEGDVAIVQPDGDKVILLFPDELGGNDRITVEPLF